MYKVNIGCGRTPTEGWLNFDNSFSLRLKNLPHGFLILLNKLGLLAGNSLRYIEWLKESDVRFCNAARHIPLGDSTVEVLYSSHMLEHLDRNEAEAFLKETYRVLCVGGVVRIAVPGLGQKIDKYLEDKDADGFIDSLYLSVEKPKDIWGRLKLAVIGPRHHHWMYDEKSLGALLEKIGYGNVTALPAGKTHIAEPGDLNLSERIEESIYVEAVKSKS